jgi:hypothetical protein
MIESSMGYLLVGLSARSAAMTDWEAARGERERLLKLQNAAGYPFTVAINYIGWYRPQGCFVSLYHARLFIDAMQPIEIGFAYIERDGIEIYRKPPPYRDPTICHECGKKLPRGCGGTDRDLTTCKWDTQ